LRSIAFLVPGRLVDTRTGGYLYDRHVIDGLRRRGWQVDVRELDEGFPHPSSEALDHARYILASFADRTVVVIDGLALGGMPDVVEGETGRLRFVGLVHLPLAADVGLDEGTAARFAIDERRALAAAALVVVTGAATVALLENYGVPRTRIAIVEPGTDHAPLARGSKDSVLQLLSVATLNPGKGHDILFRALAAVRAHHWRLTCVGSKTRHPPTVVRLRETLHRLKLEERVDLVGELDAEALASWYDRADLFVLATLRETYGMAVAEALARGLPVVSTRTGAIADLVGEEAGLLVSPGDVDALSEALSRVLEDASLHARLAAGARRVRDRLPTWEQAVDRMVAALAQVTDE
jgi:glycosyltransferase involved in cell wall biosynthesis